MAEGKVLKSTGGAKRFKQTFLTALIAVLFTILVMDTRRKSHLVPGVLTHFSNASSRLVQKPMKNYFDRNKTGVLMRTGTKGTRKLTDAIRNAKDVTKDGGGFNRNVIKRKPLQPNVVLQGKRTDTKITNKQSDLTKSKFNDSPDTESNENCTEEFRSRHFMTVSVMGRTGNQLFEICTLIATAHDACYTAFIPTDTELVLDDTFRIQNVIRKDVNISISDFKDIRGRGWAIYTKQIYKSMGLHNNYTLSGFFQSFKHFQHKQELVRSSFVFKDEIVSDVLNYFTNMSLTNKTKVGIHIRRGDFVEQKNIKLGYFPPSKEFIQKAIIYFSENFKNTDLVFIIVSDNITWCKENIRYRYVYYSPFNDSGRDLNILTQSDHNVVSSGTFGWMGAWLNETGTVVYDKSYPKYKSWLWRGYRSQDYYPPKWIGL